MTNILKAKVSIKGIRFLAWHHFGIDALPLEARERAGVAGNDPSEWKRSVLMDEERKLYLLPTYFFGCIKGGGKTVKKGKGNLLTAIASTLQVVDDQIYISDDSGLLTLPNPPEMVEAGTQKMEKLPACFVEIIGVRNPSTKARNIRYRVVAKPGWQCTFTLLWDATVCDRRSMELAMINAGQLVGVGDGRQSIGYGRFNLESFDVT
ncbi:MAG: hypothetical protein ACRCZS_25315 [Chroococcidiopsis sp.]